MLLLVASGLAWAAPPAPAQLPVQGVVGTYYLVQAFVMVGGF